MKTAKHVIDYLMYDGAKVLAALSFEGFLVRHKAEATETIPPQSASEPTDGPWSYIPSNEYHGAYIEDNFGGTICDFYCMSDPSSLSQRNGGVSRPVAFQHERADANARLCAASRQMLDALKAFVTETRAYISPECEECEIVGPLLRQADAAIAAAEGKVIP